MSLLKLSNYEGKPYSEGFSLSNVTEFTDLNSLGFSDNKKPFIGKIVQLFIYAKIETEKGPDCHVMQTIGEEDLPPVSILDPDAYENEAAGDLIPTINHSAINYVHTGRVELELENGEIISLDESDYSIEIKEGDVIAQQRFEVLPGDVIYKEAENINLYPLGVMVDPGKSVASIQPVYFRINQAGESTTLKILTTEKLSSAGGFYSTEGFEYGGCHYEFITEGDSSQHKSIQDYVKEGKITLRINHGSEGASAAAAAGRARSIEAESCELYGSQPDKIILGFKLPSAGL